MMYWDGSWSGWAWFAMTLSMVLFWAAVGVVIWLLVRRPTSPSSGPAERSPEEVLRHRYAVGDIDETEFNRRLGTLRETGKREGTVPRH
jgi:putative membrane protein